MSSAMAATPCSNCGNQSRSLLACIRTVQQKKSDACAKISLRPCITQHLACQSIKVCRPRSRLLREATQRRDRSYTETNLILSQFVAKTCCCSQMSKFSGCLWSGVLKQTISILLLVMLTFVNVNPSFALVDSAEGLKAELIKAQDEYIRARARDDLSLQDDPLLEASPEPEQVHITMAGPNRVQVTWVTSDTSASSHVQFGTKPGIYDQQADGTSLTYSFLLYRSSLIHHVVLGSKIPLLNDTLYYYRCGSSERERSFKTPPPPGPDTPISIDVIGDLGQTGWSVSTLAHVQQNPHDLILSVGDLSYADGYQPRWDSWGRLVEPLASSRPWMNVEGNHDIEWVPLLEPSFKAYNARWPNPYEASGSSSNLYYSFEAAGVHFLMLGSYADYAVESDQYEWLKADLAKVDRQKTPWLIAAVHAPWYNSNMAHQGSGGGMREAMEDMLLEAKVDVLFAGHVHAYERFARVGRGGLDPCGIVHITIGDGGNREGLASKYITPSPQWSLKREASFGHGELEIFNGSSARWTWHRNQDDEAVAGDSVVLHSHAHDENMCSASRNIS